MLGGKARLLVMGNHSHVTGAFGVMIKLAWEDALP